MKNRPQLILHPGKEKSVGRHHPWIFSGAVGKVDGSPAEGDLVDVLSSDGKWLCVGHFQKQSIMVKVLSFDTPNIDTQFWFERFGMAIRYREQLGFFSRMDETNVFRLAHAEGDMLPGLVADYYDGVVVLQAHSKGMHRMFPTFVSILTELLGDRLVSVFDKSSATLPSGKSTDGYIYGKEFDEYEVKENNCRYLVNFFEGQKTGFFVDQRDNRALLASISAGKRVANCFGYTGGFSVSALRGGASYVETIDLSPKAIELCERNVALNSFDASMHRGVIADALNYIYTMGDDFDIVVLDPPAFAKSHYYLEQALKGYRLINKKAIEKIRPGGIILTFSCSQAVSNEDFQTMVFSASNLANRKVRIIRRLSHSSDHPVSIFHPEGEYLKGLMLYVE